MKRIAVIGMGYVGCVTATCLARDGHAVVGVERDPGKVAAVNAGRSPVREPGLDDLLRQEVGAGRLSATTDIASAVQQASLAMIAVGTPSQNDGGVDIEHVQRVVEEIGAALRGTEHELTVVVRSTLLPGMLEEHLVPALEISAAEPLGRRISLCNHPEFLREATAIADYDHPPFVIVGATGPDVAHSVLDLYPTGTAEHVVTDTRSAAMVKYTCNAFHAVKVAFANEIGTLAKAFGADGHEVMRIACKDTQLNISPAYLRPGFAFGGSCLPKDVRALVRYAERQAIHTELLGAILPSNQSHIERALAMIAQTGARRIGLVGLSFKAGTDDLRESPQVTLAETLFGRGYELRIFDPDVRVEGLIGANLNYIDHHLPHLAKLLLEDEQQLFGHSELLILATGIADQVRWSDSGCPVIDLRRDLVAPDGE